MTLRYTSILPGLGIKDTGVDDQSQSPGIPERNPTGLDGVIEKVQITLLTMDTLDRGTEMFSSVDVRDSTNRQLVEMARTNPDLAIALLRKAMPLLEQAYLDIPEIKITQSTQLVGIAHDDFMRIMDEFREIGANPTRFFLGLESSDIGELTDSTASNLRRVMVEHSGLSLDFDDEQKEVDFLIKLLKKGIQPSRIRLSQSTFIYLAQKSHLLRRLLEIYQREKRLIVLSSMSPSEPEFF